jgi:hypothetical protein
MSIDRRPTRLGGALALPMAVAITIAMVVFAGPIAAKDVYKGFLDPGIPQHRATLDLLERLEKTPNDASLHNDLACLIARDGFWRDALREFNLAAKLDKADGRPLYNAGLVHTTRSEWASAASSFNKAVSRAPGNWAAWWMLGYAEERRGNDSAAVAAYKTSLRVDTSLFDVRRNPFAAYTRLKGRVLLETLDGRLMSAALPVTEQMAQADIVGSFQHGRVAVSAVTGGFAQGATAPAPGAGGAAPDDRAIRPGPGGAVVTSVPPVSTSRPAPSPNAFSAPATPAYTRANEIIPSDIPEQSPAGPGKKRSPAPDVAPGAEEGAPAPTPAPTPVRVGPGIG